jgi:hypothetical protein
MPKVNKSKQKGFLQLTSKFSTTTLLIVAFVFGVLGTYIIMSTSAARPIKPSSAAVLTGPTSAVFDPANPDQPYTVTGTGFPKDTMVSIQKTEAGGCCQAYQVYSADGTITVTGAVYERGLYKIDASLKQQNGRWGIVASWQFQAQ